MRQYTDEESILNQLTKGHNPYRAPKGYFDALPGRVMRKAKGQQRRRLVIRWAVAAIMTGCVITAGFAMLGHSSRESKRTDVAYAQYINDALDYSMIDNSEIAYYLTEAE